MSPLHSFDDRASLHLPPTGENVVPAHPLPWLIQRLVKEQAKQSSNEPTGRSPDWKKNEK